MQVFFDFSQCKYKSNLVTLILIFIEQAYRRYIERYVKVILLFTDFSGFKFYGQR